jgi:hypothetical protein
MKVNNYLTVRVVCWVVAGYHLLAGVAATLFGESAVTIGSLLYGVGIVMDGQTELLVRYLGAFAISFGVLMVFAALDPVRNVRIIHGAVVYFVVRAFDRVAFAGLLDEHTSGPMPNYGRLAMIVLFAMALLWFMPREKKKQAMAT